MVNEQHATIGHDQSSAAPDLRPPGLIASTVLGASLLALLVWQFAGVGDDGLQFQVLDPDLHPAWKAVIVATLGVSTACSLLVWLRRAWTMPYAVVNTAANWTGAAVSSR